MFDLLVDSSVNLCEGSGVYASIELLVGFSVLLYENMREGSGLHAAPLHMQSRAAMPSMHTVVAIQ